MRIWLSKPLYEVLPYFYVLAGVLCLLASMYLNYWFWPTICLLFGIACLILGFTIVLRRRDFRGNTKSDHGRRRRD